MKRHMVILLLLFGLAGCSSSGSGSADAAADKQAGLKYAQCMRENGVPDFEDPKFDEDGSIDDMSLPKDVDQKAADAAHETCREYLPNGGQAEQMNQDDLAGVQAFAKCMRENGMPDFPDPDSDGRIRFESGKTPKPDDPDLKAADEKCKHNMPGGGSGIVFGPEKDK